MVTKKSLKSVPLSSFLIGGIIAGAMAASFNTLYAFWFPILTNYSVPQDLINYDTVALTSFFPICVGSILYYLISRFINRATILYITAAITLSVLCLIRAFSPVLPNGHVPPDGFTTLTLPMHVVAGLIAVLVVPLFVEYD